MPTDKLFANTPNIPWLDSFIYGLMGLVVVLAILLLLAGRGKDTRVYDAKLAWLRAWIYFSACWIISWATGVLPVLLSSPLLNPEHLTELSWQAFMVVGWAVVLFGYLYIWPKGTVTYNRKLYPLSTLVLGVVWGLSEAQLFLSFWAIGESFIDRTWLIALFTYLLVSMSNGPLHFFYWDRYVSPDHNIYEWNMKKVGLAHNPTLIVALIYLSVWGIYGCISCGRLLDY
ncbi:hypothetical protein [Oceanicoccus sagamiensis]|uniref:Uncharacterized protein n=1 Tax=Oceanicoccus sagamiensis TaxID=716816 RepID=A0A1X9NIZ0_9GAMM|nr:hypothetical protein [Oceanicoccus sagamiensis]ARN75805.1 hypothetical protein BST96_17840 [Oceanicoccus sagamiensis]